MKKSIAYILAILSITALAESGYIPLGASLLDDLTSESWVVVDAFLNSSNSVHELIESVSPRTSLEPATNYTDRLRDDLINGELTAALAEQADNAGFAEKAYEADYALDLGRDGSSRPAAQIFAELDAATTTNDVCAIVTNEVRTFVRYTDWELYIEGDKSTYDFDLIWTESEWYAVIFLPSETEYFSMGGDYDSVLLSYGVIEFRREAIYESRNTLGLARLSDLPPLTNGLISADFIATNNPAFVAAVTNCPVAIASSDAEALAEWGIYGGGGTIGALLAALAAAVVALRKKKMPLYPVGGTGNPVNATIESGVLTISPFAMAAYTPTASAAFSVAMGALPSDMEAGKARDAVLVIDCSSLSEGDEPTVTWGTAFHPRTDAGTDFACAAGVRNVYYISEYAPSEFAVGGWTETAGGNA